MPTAYIMAALAVFFLVIGSLRLARDGGRRHPQSRAWLLIGVIFAAVSAFLFYQE